MGSQVGGHGAFGSGLTGETVPIDWVLFMQLDYWSTYAGRLKRLSHVAAGRRRGHNGGGGNLMVATRFGGAEVVH